MQAHFDVNLFHTAIRRSPRKNEKRPVYVLNICVKPEEVDNCIEPSKNRVELGVSRFFCSDSRV